MSKTHARAMLRQGIRASSAVVLRGKMSNTNLLKPRERIGLWLWAHADLVGLAIVAGVGLAVGLSLLIALVPMGPSTEIRGVLVGTSAFQGKYGNRPMGVVQLSDGGVHTMRLVHGNRCVVGNTVIVLRTRKLWGVDHAIKTLGCNT